MTTVARTIFSLALWRLLTTIVQAEPSAAQSESVLTNTAVSQLRRDLRDEPKWIKVHAAEALLRLSYQNEIVSLFTHELLVHSDEPGYRIGIWRVLAKAAEPTQQEQYLQNIRAAALDEHGPDVAHALEALAKLRHIPSVADRLRIEVIVESLSDIDKVYGRWLLAIDGDPQKIRKLAQLLDSNDLEVRGAAAYALRHQAQKLPEDVAAKIIELARQDSAHIYVLSCAYLITLDHRGAEFKQRLLKYAHNGTKDQRHELCAVLAIKGTDADVPLLTKFLADSDADVRVGAAGAVLRIARRRPTAFSWLDWLVLASYAVGMMLIGWAYSRVSNVEEYLLGGRAMKPWAVGISLFATLMSTLTYLAYPGEIIQHGPMILSGILTYPLVYLLVGQLIIPTIMKLRVVSAYEILEQRFGVSVRMLGSAMFLTLRFMWMALIVYATSNAVLVPLLRLNPSATPWVCVVLAMLTIAYTSMGGLQAVVFTDVLQTFIMLAGAMLSLVMISISLGGVAAWWPRTWHNEWDIPRLLFAPDSRSSIGMAMIASFTWYVCTACSDQMAVQRYLATRDISSARKMFGISLICDTCVALLLALLGLALFAYFTAHPEMLADETTVANSADQLLPRYIVKVLPAGIAGLVVAGILSAAMDSLSSGLNSTCSVITVDWLDRWRGEKLQSGAELRRAKLVSWIVGGVVIVLSLCAMLIPGNLLEQCYTIVNLLVSPLAVLFFMAIFVPWATTAGTWSAAVVSTVVAIRIAYFKDFGLSFLMIMPVSLIAGMIVGCTVSFLPIGVRKPMLDTTVE